MKTATAFVTMLVTHEIEYEVNDDWPEDFALWSKDTKYDWLDENAVNQFVVASESYGDQMTIDNVFFDE